MVRFHIDVIKLEVYKTLQNYIKKRTQTYIKQVFIRKNTPKSHIFYA